MLYEVYLALGAAVGAALNVYMTTEQENFSRKSVVQVVLSAAAGYLYPLYPVLPLPEASVASQAVLMGVMSYAGADFGANLMTRIKEKIEEKMQEAAKKK